jgi:hypothetical protein
MRWITFDQETCSSLRASRPQESVFEFPARSALEYALENSDAIVAVMPAGLNDTALVTFRRGKVPLLDGPPRGAQVTRATGFLGLVDEPVFQEEEGREKRSWWRRFWDE